jgi:lipopolysaccharide export system protein LptA
MNPSRLFTRLGLAALGGVALALGGAQAQTRSDAPVEITADEFVGLNQQGLAIYRGSVEAVQADARLRCSELRVQFSRRGGGGGEGQVVGGGGDAERYICEGPVWYVTPREVARGNHGEYVTATDTITLTGDVVLRQGPNVAQGDTLTINTRTNDSRLSSNTPGSGPNRVRSVLYPDSAPARGGQQPGTGGR